MSDDREITIEVSDLPKPTVLRELAASLREDRWSWAPQILDDLADKIEALPTPRMAEPKKFGSVVTATIPPSGRTDFVLADPGEPISWFSPLAGWAEWDDLVNPEPLP